MEALQAFRLIRRITDFFKAYTVTPNLPTEFLQLQIKMIQSEYGAELLYNRLHCLLYGTRLW